MVFLARRTPEALGVSDVSAQGNLTVREARENHWRVNFKSRGVQKNNCFVFSLLAHLIFGTVFADLIIWWATPALELSWN